LLLHILFRTPKWGKPIFKRLFDAIKATEILAFLDEETKLQDEVKIFYALQWNPFIKAVFYDIFSIDRIKNSILVPLFVTFIFLVFDGLGVGYINDITLLAGLVFIGIPHGAVDHLIEHNRFNEPIHISFIIRYLAQGALVVLLWYLSPALALFFFVGYSILSLCSGRLLRMGSESYFGLVMGNLIIYRSIARASVGTFWCSK